MYFYKTINNNEVSLLQTCNAPLKTSDTFINITESEYNILLAELIAKGEKELQKEIEASKTQEQLYVENLEKENAALLYQLLTGEEFADV